MRAIESGEVLSSSAKRSTRTRTVCALGLGVLISLAACQQSAERGADRGWKEFAPKDGGFSVLLPGTPTEGTSSEATELGVISSTWFDLDLEGDKLRYSLRYDDYPGDILALGDVMLILARQKQLELHVQGKTVADEDVFLGGSAGKQFTLELPDGNLAIYRVFLVGPRMYQLGAQASKEEVSAAEIAEFLDSFRLL